ncbi:hypothetical protein GIB67_005035 [Kingdonia uniflora]|uniref:WW domain-containing protein n=1 Tax=Kingdonia uniflora TaxID=39325 RepID=A0A7J7NN14_9MAGN|nr:hypothetical protein GIB67_005035 [Kingdonia uniflora]
MFIFRFYCGMKISRKSPKAVENFNCYHFLKRSPGLPRKRNIQCSVQLSRGQMHLLSGRNLQRQGRRYYYNKVTKQSKWTIPDELKLAREQAENMTSLETASEVDLTSLPPVAVTPTSVETHSAAISGVSSSPVQVTPVATVADPLPVGHSVSQASAMPSSLTADAIGVHSPLATVNHLLTVKSVNAGGPAALPNTTVIIMSTFESTYPQAVASSVDGVSVQDLEVKPCLDCPYGIYYVKKHIIFMFDIELVFRLEYCFLVRVELYVTCTPHIFEKNPVGNTYPIPTFRHVNYNISKYFSFSRHVQHTVPDSNTYPGTRVNVTWVELYRRHFFSSHLYDYEAKSIWIFSSNGKAFEKA